MAAATVKFPVPCVYDLARLMDKYKDQEASPWSPWDDVRRALQTETRLDSPRTVESVRMRSTIGSCGNMCHAPRNVL